MRHIIAILIFFILAQVIGIFVGSVLIEDSENNPYVQSLFLESGSGVESSFVDLIFIFAMILFGTAVLLYLFKHYKGKILFFLIELVMVSFPASIVIYSIFRVFEIGFLESMVVGIVLGIALALLNYRYRQLRNVAAIFSSAAIGALFGISFAPLFVIIFLIILAVYDYISVFKTKHMVTLAKGVMKTNMPLTISSTTTPREKDKKRIDLGTGDILAPIMLEVSFLKFSFNASIVVLIGSVISVLGIFIYIRNKKVILPALPPIVGGILIFLLLGYLIGII